MIQINNVKKIIIIPVLIGLMLPNFSLTPTPKFWSWGFARAQNQFQLPENLSDVKQIGERAREAIKTEMPGTLKQIWEEQVLPIWQKMYQWFKGNIWDPYLLPFYKNQVEPRFQQELEKRKPIIEEEFQKEKEQLKTELPVTLKSLWEKFKELIK